MHGRCEANPVRIDDPVWRQEEYIGRTNKVRRILRLIKQGQSVSVVGPPGCGKSTLLNYITRAAVFEQHGLCADALVFLRLSGRAYADLDQALCLCAFCREIQVQLERFDVDLRGRLARADTEFVGHRGLRALFRIALESGLKSVLVLDDFDDLAQNNSLQDSFFAALRSLATGYQVVYLVASRRPLYELEKARPEASTLCGICQQFLLSSLVEQT